MKIEKIKVIFLMLALLCMGFGVEAEHADYMLLVVVLVVSAIAFGLVGTFWK